MKNNNLFPNFNFLLIELRINRNNTNSYSVYGLCFILDSKEIKDIRNLIYDITFKPT